MGIKGNFFNTIKAIYEKPTANITINGGKEESFYSKIQYKARMPTHGGHFHSTQYW